MKKYVMFLSLLVVGVFSNLSCIRKNDDNPPIVPAEEVVDTAFTAQLIVNDMTKTPDASLHGTEALDWGMGIASPQPMPVPRQNNQGKYFRSLTCWGQVYIPRTNSTALNTRCQIRNVVTKILKKDGLWYTVQSGQPKGAAFVEDFANNGAMDAGVRDESSNGGGISVIVGVGNWAGHNYHFWVDGRAQIDPEHIDGVYTSCEARLIVDDPSKTDDRANCKNLLQMGADWWLSVDAAWLPDWSASSGIGGGRSKWVKTYWQHYSMCTLPADQILINSPIGNSSSEINVSGVTLSDTVLHMQVTDSKKLIPIIIPLTATNQLVKWSSSDSTIVVVATDGTVSALAAGNVIIKATTVDQHKTATCNIDIIESLFKNLALNKTATASSVEQGLKAENAVDGNVTTRWASQFTDNEWIYVDLGETVDISSVKLKWETAYGKSYKIFVSDDASAWNEVYSTTSSDGGTDEITGLTAKGRYVKMQGVKRNTSWGYSLYEFEVY